MASKVGRQILKTSMEQILTFELELSFPAELEPAASTLIETISDAIRDHDYRHRLLPGYRRPRGGERLTGISVSLTKTRTEVSRFDGMVSHLAPPDPPEQAKTEPTRHAIIDVSTEIDRRIEKLREAQAHLWTIYDKLWNPGSDRGAAQAEHYAERAMALVSDLLAGKAASPKRRRPNRNGERIG